MVIATAFHGIARVAANATSYRCGIRAAKRRYHNYEMTHAYGHTNGDTSIKKIWNSKYADAKPDKALEYAPTRYN